MMGDGLRARIYRHQAPLFLAKPYLGLVSDLTWDPNRASPIGDSPRELVSLAGLVTPCQSTQVVLSTVWIVHLHCLQMRLLQPFHRFEDCGETIRFAHFRRGEVCVTSGAIPITHCDFWLGIERDTNSEHLSDTVENVSGDPELISHIDSFAGSNLVFPLSWSYFRVCTEDVNTGMKACAVVSLDDFASESTVGANTAVILSLWCWVTMLRPSEWMLISVDNQVFLLHSEPWMLIGNLFHDGGTCLTMIGD
ncbi:hypothetical protein GCK72_008733 [Caenorhabditis remanei]|uniref:Uncharacterized protein n=1 Tax=Caenorhabditis remanei TaxID=31234 RepID=A0A6A5H132_CAERE|nr:hypothetical protein GCK72_008733 [Caenorhabditis remanei]KAF1760484.1 hypothetical protein GCK72_008733 [Caenorhabditis remanei]